MFNPFKKKPFEIGDFAKLVITEAKKAGIAESLEYDPKRFALKRGGQRTYLVNLFNDYRQADEAHKKRILGNTLALLRQKKPDIPLEEAKSQAVAAVREQALFSFTTLWWQLENGPGASHSITYTKSVWPGLGIARSRNLKNSKAFTSVDGTMITTTLAF